MIQASSSRPGRAEAAEATASAVTADRETSAWAAGCGDAADTSIRRPSPITARTPASPNTSAARSGGSSTSTGT